MSNPWRGPLMFSLGSTPGGDSILIMLAPKSANCFSQVGPARTRDRSRIPYFASAGDAGRCGMVVRPVQNDKYPLQHDSVRDGYPACHPERSEGSHPRESA